MAEPQNPHAGQPVLHRGASLDDARLVAILIHGRGASAEDILSLAAEFDVHDVAYLAPQAANRTWYPYSFLSPIAQNEPYLTSALGVVASLVTTVVGKGIPAERVALLGFSQGACLTLEFSARNPRRYAAIVGLSGGLIGPPDTPRQYPGSLDGTPVFLGCSDVDAHIPVERVRETTAVLRTMKATVDERIYRGMGHTVNSDEVSAVTALLQGNRD
jgi:phospholipase/carboxylesterase/glyoxalase family protein